MDHIESVTQEENSVEMPSQAEAPQSAALEQEQPVAPVEGPEGAVEAAEPEDAAEVTGAESPEDAVEAAEPDEGPEGAVEAAEPDEGPENAVEAAEPDEGPEDAVEAAEAEDTAEVTGAESSEGAVEAAEPEKATEVAEPDEGPEDAADAAEAEEEVRFSAGDVGDDDEPALDQAAEMAKLSVEDWDYTRPRRGQVRTGIILNIRDEEIIVDIGAKRDGIVPSTDLERMGEEAIAKLSPGDEVMVFVMRPEDKEGNLLVSLHMARQEKAWKHAKELHEKGDVWEGEVIGYNKGGLVVPVEEIRGFVPASQVPGFPSGLSQEDRLERLSERVGDKLMVKVIEIDRRKRRLILSATRAQREWRRAQRERLLEELREGEVRTGHVTSLCSFGAFVDLGGADGLVHLSELSWRRIRHPREVVSVGEEVEVYVLRLDHERKRIGLSLKRLQPEPWSMVEENYELGQLVEGLVTNVVDFGAFAEIEPGVEGLIHVSELSDIQVSHPRDIVKKGDLLLLRIIRIDARRKRLGLSLKRVLESEWAEWAARLAIAEAEKKKAEEEAKRKKTEEKRAQEEAKRKEAEAEAEAKAEAEADAEAPAEGEAEAAVEPEADAEAPAEAPAEPEADAEAPADADA
ncbi:MAG: S1 RNA-binding domain-containing protein, partial [Anaerolineae bacterium]